MTIENTLQLERMNILLPDGTKVNEPKLGDIFTFSIKEGEYMFGRVIADKVLGQGISEGKLIVIYIYNVTSKSKTDVQYSSLTLDNLLAGPFILLKENFKFGYLEIIYYESINDVNVHFPICFEIRHLVGNPCENQLGEKIEKQKICGMSGIWNIAAIEQKVCMALGLPVADYSEKKESKKSNIFIDIKISEYEGTYSVTVDIQENITKVFEAYGEGLIGNGYEMESLIKNIIKNKNPKLLESMDFDSEANMFCLRTENKEIVEEVKNIITETLHNENALMTEIKNVPEEEWD